MRYDLHIHSKFSSCSDLLPSVILKQAKAVKLDGIAVTDHNSIKGSLEVARLNRSKDFVVIKGAEIRTANAEVLAYYINEEIKSRDIYEVIDEIHRQGGLAVIAHPMALPRQSLTIPLKDLKKKIDGIEILNARSLPFENYRAKRLAKELGIPGTAGSDAHFSFEIGQAVSIYDGDLRRSLKSGRIAVSGSSILAPFGSFMSMIRKRF